MTRRRSAAFAAPTLSLLLAFVLPSATGTLPAVRAQDDGSQEIGELNKKGCEALNENRFDEAIAEFNKMIALIQKGGLSEGAAQEGKRLAYYNLACAFSKKGEKDKACEWFEKSVTEGEFWDWSHIEKDTDLENIRGDARYKAAIEKGRGIQRKKLISKEPLIPDYELSIKPIEGEKIKGESLKGKVVVIDLFAHIERQDPSGKAVIVGGWETSKDLSKLYEEKKDKGLMVVGMILIPGSSQPGPGESPWIEGEDAKEKAKPIVEKLGLKFPVGIASDKQRERAQCDPGAGQPFPVILVLDKAGKVRAKLGPAERSAETVAEIVNTLLAEAGPAGVEPKKEEPKKEEPKKEEPKKEEPKKEEPKKEEPKKKDEPLF